MNAQLLMYTNVAAPSYNIGKGVVSSENIKNSQTIRNLTTKWGLSQTHRLGHSWTTSSRSTLFLSPLLCHYRTNPIPNVKNASTLSTKQVGEEVEFDGPNSKNKGEIEQRGNKPKRGVVLREERHLVFRKGHSELLNN